MKNRRAMGYEQGSRESIARKRLRRIMLGFARKYAAELGEMDKAGESGARRKAKEKALASLKVFIKWHGWDDKGGV